MLPGQLWLAPWSWEVARPLDHLAIDRPLLDPPVQGFMAAEAGCRLPITTNARVFQHSERGNPSAFVLEKETVIPICYQIMEYN